MLFILPKIISIPKFCRAIVRSCWISGPAGAAPAAQFGVMSIPTLVVLKNGREVNRSVGAKPKSQILAML